MPDKRRILLVDDEVAILLTLKAVLEISGFQVDSAASAKEAKRKLKHTAYTMVITDMRMESDKAGRQVIQAARKAEYQPAIALLTAFPVAEEDWQEMGADNMLVKPMQIQILLKQIEALLESHSVKLGTRAHSEASALQPAASAVTPKRAVKKISVAKTAKTTAKRTT